MKPSPRHCGRTALQSRGSRACSAPSLPEPAHLPFSSFFLFQSYCHGGKATNPRTAARCPVGQHRPALGWLIHESILPTPPAPHPPSTWRLLSVRAQKGRAALTLFFMWTTWLRPLKQVIGEQVFLQSRETLPPLSPLRRNGGTGDIPAHLQEHGQLLAVPSAHIRPGRCAWGPRNP